MSMGRGKQCSSPWFGILCSVAFFGASNYCNLEAVAAHPAHSERSHHATASEHQDNDASSTPAHDHEDASDACCAAVQAVTSPKIAFHLTSNLAWQLHPLMVRASWLTSLLDPIRAASGLSPPPREPTSVRPFYRTTYANHAPPVRLT